MAASAKQFSIFIVLTLLLSIHTTTHARDSQFFNKIPSTTNNVAIPNNNNNEASPLTNNQQEQQDPTFIPQTENPYGLYGHEAGQLPPSATALTGEPSTTTTAEPAFNMQFEQPVHKYLPKNYNPVAYVTQPENTNEEAENFAEDKSFTTATNPNNNNNYYYNNNNNNQQQEQQENEYKSSYPTTTRESNNNYYYNNNNNNQQQEQQETEYNNYPTTTRENNNNNYNGGSSFNSQPQGMSDTRYSTGAALNRRERYSNNVGVGGFEPQGMSDTRFVENGKYFYDVNTEKYSSSHPYGSLRNVQTRNNNNYYGNAENSGFQLNGENSNVNGGYLNEEEQFQEEDNSMP